MKIGFDVAQTCAEKAGCGWYADSLIRAMVALAPEHHYYLYHQFGRWINESTDHGTHIASPSVTETFTDVTPAEAARIWGSPDEIVLKTGAPEIIHANCFQAPKVRGSVLVYTIYDVSFWSVPQFTTEANRLICQRGVLEALQHADGFVFISESARSEFEEMLPGWLASSLKPSVVTPLAARSSSSNAEISASGKYWLAVGSLEPRKNYDAALDAIEYYWTLSSQRIPLRIAGGRGWNSERLHRRISDLASRGMVEPLGYVADAHLTSLYQNAFGLLFPSWYEGFGLPILEALTLGCPVICSRTTSLPEVGGDAVIYIDAQNPTTIAEAMLRLESDANFRAAQRNLGLQQAQKFSWTRTAKSTLDFYADLLALHKRHN